METTDKEDLDNLLNDNNEIKKRKTTRIIIGVVAAVVLVAIIVIIVVVIKSKENIEEETNNNEGGKDKEDEKPKDPDYKFTSITTVNIPEGITYDSHAIYSKKGRILFTYKKDDDNKTYIGVMDEDGSNLNTLWSGEWKPYYQSNGLRLMPFDDNKKILTGDYVLECTPDIDNCLSSTLYPVIYPTEAVNMLGVYFVWSEIIVSPDEHIGWSTLSLIYDDVNFIGQLVKKENNYIITNVQIISTLGFINYEDEEKGILKHDTIRGGEIKQFTNGGEAITLAGAGDSALAKSVFQNLVGEENYQITHFPGYEETTIISPDGKLGLVMTTRFSPKTSSEILGYMPRPLSVYTVSKMNRYAYFYGIQEVRRNRNGNIGPALINIEESKTNVTYMGYDLHDEGWAFNSPLSWHPSSKKAMFTENKKNTNIKRIRIVNLDNYKPSKIIENKSTPDDISYAKTLDDLNNTIIGEVNGYFKGKNSGIMIFNKTENNSRSEYINYSDDGKLFYNGYEEFEQINNITGKLTSELIMSGEKKGVMNLTLTMNYGGYIINKKGYVDYNGKKIDIDECY
jgi:hypothetical protein